jgi:HlyD family secretion protein
LAAGKLPPPRRRAVIALLLPIALAAMGFAAWRWQPIWRGWFASSENAGRILVSGNIEAHQTVLSFTQVQAPITELPFDEGAAVKKGTVLARVDDRLYRQQVEIDHANIQIAATQVQVNQSALIAAENNVASDQFDLAQKQKDYDRAETLAKSSAGSIQARDQAQTAMRQAAAAYARDQAVVQEATANIALARANEAQMVAKLQLDLITLGYAELTAPFDGVLAVRTAELGQLAGPGVAIFTLNDLDHPWLRAYVNEPDLGRVRLGQAVDVTTDAYPGHVYHGRISFISPQAEFTPKTVETHAERVTQVYRIRIDLENPTHELLPGMPADGTIALLPPGQ